MNIKGLPSKENTEYICVLYSSYRYIFMRVYSIDIVHLPCVHTEVVQTMSETQAASAIIGTDYSNVSTVFPLLKGLCSLPGEGQSSSRSQHYGSVWAIKAKTLDLTMTNEAANGSTQSQVVLIGLSYPQTSSTQKFISLLAL